MKVLIAYEHIHRAFAVRSCVPTKNPGPKAHFLIVKFLLLNNTELTGGTRYMKIAKLKVKIWFRLVWSSSPVKGKTTLIKYLSEMKDLDKPCIIDANLINI